MHTHTFSNTDVEIKVQLAEVGSLLLPKGLGIGTQVVRLHGKHLLPFYSLALCLCCCCCCCCILFWIWCQGNTFL